MYNFIAVRTVSNAHTGSPAWSRRLSDSPGPPQNVNRHTRAAHGHIPATDMRRTAITRVHRYRRTGDGQTKQTTTCRIPIANQIHAIAMHSCMHLKPLIFHPRLYCIPHSLTRRPCPGLERCYDGTRSLLLELS